MLQREESRAARSRFLDEENIISEERRNSFFFFLLSFEEGGNFQDGLGADSGERLVIHRRSSDIVSTGILLRSFDVGHGPISFRSI